MTSVEGGEEALLPKDVPNSESEAVCLPESPKPENDETISMPCISSEKETSESNETVISDEKEKREKETHSGGTEETKDDHDFAAIEGELLDFEDFNMESVDRISKNGGANGNQDGATPAADRKLSTSACEDGACSEGELNDEDLEEGELREPSLSEKVSETQPSARQVCRFYHRGLCFYGSACRFVHVTNNSKGNYSMFESTPRVTQSGFPNQHFGGHRQPPPRPLPPEFVPAPVLSSFSVQETAWEKGLKEAKQLLKQSSIKRKDDPQFDVKKNYLNIEKNEKNFENEKKVEELKEKRAERYEAEYGGFDPYMYNRREKDSRDRSKRERKSAERRFSNAHKGRNRLNLMQPPDMERPFFVDQFFDPWRRSKSPNHRLSRERDRSPHSFTSSSYSRSPPSSRSTSRSVHSLSCRSSRRASSSRSRSVSRNSSRSRSISMDSVSSASSQNSTVSHSSSGSELLRQQEIKDVREKPPAMTYPDSTTVENKFEGIASILKEKRDLLEEKFEDAPPVEMDLRYIIPKLPEKKEPIRLALTHKNPIKLTLLNKFPPSKAGFSKDSKEFAIKKPEEPLKTNILQGVKRPLSPSESAEPVKPTPVLLPKKSASSRRDELLKQLKAVEDAIARKRAKF